MNSREIVRRTFEFSCPQRVAHSFYPSDMLWSGIHIPGEYAQWKRVGEKEWSRIDEWGNLWKRKDSASGGERVRGGLQNLDAVNEFSFPDFSNHLLYEPIKEIFRKTPDKWHIGLLSGSTFEIANTLLEHYMTAIYTNLPAIRILHDRIDSLLKFQIQGFKNSGADSVMIIEDPTDTFGLFPGPSLWKDEFKPRLKELIEYAHRLNLSVIMHSLVETSFVTDLILSGIDCIELDSPQSLGIDALKRLQEQYSITFWCPVDIHTTLQTKSEFLIRKDVQEMLDKLWRGVGGFIAGYYWDNQSIGLTPEWQEYASDEFIRIGNCSHYKPPT